MKYDLNLLRVFDAVMEERNVTAAAARLSLSQSAVSSALSRLRALYGDELFLRARYGVVPTEKAHAIAPVISESLQQLDRVTLGTASFDPATAQRTFRLAASGYFECVLIPPLMALTSQLAPKVSVDVYPLSGELESGELASGRIDMALGRFAAPADHLVITELIEDDLVCLVRRDDARGRKRLSRKQFQTLPHVAVSPPGRWRTGVFRQLDKAGLTRRVQLRVSHFLAVGPAILENGVCATLPRRIAMLFAQDRRFCVLEPPVDLGTFPTQMAWHPRYRRDSGHRWIRDLIRTLREQL